MLGSLETDYVVIGTGAAGMAFTDTLLSHSDATVSLVDRRHAPGGHWIDAYPFVHLHQPSAFYGVSSVPLGHAKSRRFAGGGVRQLFGCDQCPGAGLHHGRVACAGFGPAAHGQQR